MATTHKYNYNILIPIALENTPLAFSIFHKGFDENNNDLGNYTYVEHASLPGNKAFYTPSGSHAILGTNITSIHFKRDVEALLVGTPFVVVDSTEVEKWEDVDQANYIWTVTTEPLAPAYNYEAFMKVNPLFNTGV